MRIIVISDIHGRKENLGLLPSCDLTLICGDITRFGQGHEIEEDISRLKGRYFAVPGNCDDEDVIEYLEKKDVSLHAREREFNGITLYGVGGGRKSSGTPTEFSEEEFEAMLPKKKVDILVTHMPPKDLLDAAMFGVHIGSSAIRKYIERFQPIFSFCGHVHENRGIQKLGSTKVINPGPLKEGYYAQMEWEEKKIELKKI